MKINLQKIIALTVAITVIISILNISAFAEGEDNTFTAHEYMSQQSSLIDSYANGDITFSEFSVSSQALSDKYVEQCTLFPDSEATKNLVAVGNTILAVKSKIEVAVEKWGDGARERVSDWWNNVTGNVPTETTQTSTIDMYGYGACIAYTSGSDLFHTYCQYIVIDLDNNSFTRYAPNQTLSFFKSGPIWGRIDNKSFIDELDFSKYKFYGDVRYKDGTQAPTDDEWEYDTIKKFDDMSEKDLEDLLNDFAEEMDRQNPDLSSIEGLLKAIYARMGTLDSDNDNALLSEVLAAIKAIKSSDKDNSELLELLEDIKNSLVFNDGENKETFSEQLKKIIDNQITRDDFKINEDLYNNHGEILKQRLLGKFPFIYNMKKFVTYCFDVYSNTSENPEFNVEYDGNSYSVDFNVFSEYLPTIQLILAASVYLTYAYHTYRKIPSYINGGDNE